MSPTKKSAIPAQTDHRVDLYDKLLRTHTENSGNIVPDFNGVLVPVPAAGVS